VLSAGAYAKIQLITDRSASVGALIERNRRQGVIRGNGEGTLELDYVPVQADVRVGDLVVTAGIDGVYPRGVPVGSIAAIAAGTELFHRIRVVPLVDFGLLDQVFILDREAIREVVKEDRPGASP
jgi:rod shape-determining protein MreC